MQKQILKVSKTFTSGEGVRWKVTSRLMLYTNIFGIGTKYFTFRVVENYELDNSSIYPYYFTPPYLIYIDYIN